MRTTQGHGKSILFQNTLSTLIISHQFQLTGSGRLGPRGRPAQWRATLGTTPGLVPAPPSSTEGTRRACWAWSTKAWRSAKMPSVHPVKIKNRFPDRPFTNLRAYEVEIRKTRRSLDPEVLKLWNCWSGMLQPWPNTSRKIHRSTDFAALKIKKCLIVVKNIGKSDRPFHNLGASKSIARPSCTLYNSTI